MIAAWPGSLGVSSFLSIQSVTKSYGDLTVVDNLSLGIDKGEFVSILGSSGCGKTTLLRMIAGFIDSNSGAIFLDQKQIDNIPSHRREAAMVFQNYALFPHMTVFENVAFGLRRRKLANSEIKTRVDEALDLVELEALGGRYPAELSGGQQQRVAMARAVVLKPKLLLLDEPLSNLDARLRKQLRLEFLKIHRAAGITTLFVTHDLEEAFSVSDRVAILNHGRVEQFGPPGDLFWRPKTQYVANFIGHSNIVQGRLDHTDAGQHIEVGTHRIKVPSGTAAGGKARFAIPSHLIALSADPAPGFDNSMVGVLKEVVYLGHSMQVFVHLGELTLSCELPANPAALRFKDGDRIFASWRSNEMIPLPDEESAHG